MSQSKHLDYLLPSIAFIALGGVLYNIANISKKNRSSSPATNLFDWGWNSDTSYFFRIDSNSISNTEGYGALTVTPNYRSDIHHQQQQQQQPQSDKFKEKEEQRKNNLPLDEEKQVQFSTLEESSSIELPYHDSSFLNIPFRNQESNLLETKSLVVEDLGKPSSIEINAGRNIAVNNDINDTIDNTHSTNLTPQKTNSLPHSSDNSSSSTTTTSSTTSSSSSRLSNGGSDRTPIKSISPLKEVQPAHTPIPAPSTRKTKLNSPFIAQEQTPNTAASNLSHADNNNNSSIYLNNKSEQTFSSTSQYHYRRNPPNLSPFSYPGELTRISSLVAAACSNENNKPTSERLFSDPYSILMAGEKGVEILNSLAQELKVSPSTITNPIAILTRYIDDRLVELTSKNIKNTPSFNQIVLLGVGGSTRTFRLPLSSDVTVYEIDRDQVMAFRETIIQQIIKQEQNQNTSPCKANTVCIAANIFNNNNVINNNFDSDNNNVVTNNKITSTWSSLLLSNGFDQHKPSIFVCEHQLMYIKKKQVEELLAILSSLMVSGSRFYCDLFNEQYFQHSNMINALDIYEKYIGRPLSGYDLPEAVFSRNGFRAQVSQYGQEHQVDYGLISSETKEFYFKKHVRGSDKDWPRQWIISAVKS